MKTNKITFLGIMLSLSLILSYVDSLIPLSTYVPGMKIGLANIITMYVLFNYRVRDAFIIMLLRVLISGLLFSGINSIIFGLTGGVLCIIFMTVSKKTRLFSVIGVSVIGSLSHNLGQVLAAFIIMDNINVMYYFPFLLITGLFTGAVIGYISGILIRRFEKIWSDNTK